MIAKGQYTITDLNDGVGVSSVDVKYYKSTSSTSLTGGSWSTTSPTWEDGKYIWSKTVTKYTNGTSKETNPVCITGAKGPTGATGETGSAGKGVKSTAITYQSSSSGTTAPTGTWNTSIPTVAEGNYLWTRTVITYTDNSTSTAYSVGMVGKTGSTGATGSTGPTGPAGKGVKSSAVTYQASTSGTVVPTGTWSTTIPSVSASQYLWTRTIITYTDDTSTTSYSVGMIGKTGSTGTGITSITEEYYLSTSKTTQSGGSWVTTPPVWSTGMYMWTRSKIVYKNPTSTTYTTPVCDSSWEAVNELEEKVDMKAEIWFYEGAPTLSNNPVSGWDIEEYENHVGDLYYDTSTGYAYRFKLDSGVFSWERIQDQDTIESLAKANAAQDTADNKRRVFLAPPLPPYDNGDLWLNDGEIYVCQIAKTSEEEYTEGDFIIAVNYTDDTLANQVGEELKILRGTVTTIKESTDEYKIQFDTSIKTIQNETKETTEALETMSYSFGTKELKIANSDDPVNATFNNRGVKVYTYKDLETIMNHNGLGTNKLIVIGDSQLANIKITKATDENGKPCTDFHHLISTIQEITDLE